jgi:hypothetical protein
MGVKTNQTSFLHRNLSRHHNTELKWYKQTKSVNNRKTENRNDPDLVQAYSKEMVG